MYTIFIPISSISSIFSISISPFPTFVTSWSHLQLTPAARIHSGLFSVSLAWSWLVLAGLTWTHLGKDSAQENAKKKPRKDAHVPDEELLNLCIV